MNRYKRATIIVQDVGESMGSKSFLYNKNRHDIASEITKKIIEQKLIYEPSAEIAVILFGTTVTSNPLAEEDVQGYEFIQVISNFDKPSFQVVENFKLSIQEQNHKITGDFISALLLALDLLGKHTGTKSYLKNLIVITDAGCDMKDPADLEKAINFITSEEISIEMIGIDFDLPELENTTISQEKMEKPKNETLLKLVCKETNGVFLTYEQKLKHLQKTNKKYVNTVTKFRGDLEIGELKIPVYSVGKIKKETLPSLKKQSLVSYDPETKGHVKMDRIYTSASHSNEEIDSTRRVKAFKYGDNLIPFSQADMESLKFQSTKSLLALGCLPKNKINYGMLTASTDRLIADLTKPNAAKAISSLARALDKMESIFVARFVVRQNSAPNIVAMIPDVSKDDESDGFWIQRLPFIEDLRLYEFPSLQAPSLQPTEAQVRVCEDLVDNLALKIEEEDESKSMKYVDNAPSNPILQRFYMTALARSSNPDASIVEDADIESDVRPNKELFCHAQDTLSTFQKLLPLKDKAKDKGKKSFWSDMPIDGQQNIVESLQNDLQKLNTKVEYDSDTGSDIDLDAILGADEIEHVGSMNPVSDFETILGYKKYDRTANAIKEMKEIICKLFEEGSEYFPKAIYILKHFRRRCCELCASEDFNEYIRSFKEKYADTEIWKAIVKEAITLLSLADDPLLETTIQEAKKFISDDSVATETTETQEQNNEEDDMFAELE